MAKNFKTIGQGKLSKVWARLNMIGSEFWEKGTHYSWKLAVYNTVWWIGNYCPPLNKLQFWGTRKITGWMDRYLAAHGMTYGDLAPVRPTEQRVEVYHIWVFWWQGEEGMPELVKSCYRQLCQNNPNVVLITQQNINDYCHIPQYIFDKVTRGDISFTHLSDILRISLLAEHGGLWLDSTCWVPAELPQHVTHAQFISPCTRNLPAFPGWSNSRWCCWGMGTCVKGNPLFVFARDLMYAFFKCNDRFPFYLFQDYIYDYAYRHSADIAKMLDEMPENSTGRNRLHFLLNTAWDEGQYRALVQNNWVFKLSYKSVWKARTPDGKPTFYGVLMDSANARN